MRIRSRMRLVSEGESRGKFYMLPKNCRSKTGEMQRAKKKKRGGKKETQAQYIALTKGML